ncbi:MAG: hypothetical protein M1839_007426 [Geoglossum umbratile]|nr:MAG: hypothetical protein M1839_007426 [Geoglossum umbratile]
MASFIKKSQEQPSIKELQIDFHAAERANSTLRKDVYLLLVFWSDPAAIASTVNVTMTTPPGSSRAKGEARTTDEDTGSLLDDPPSFDQTILLEDDTVSWEFPGKSKDFNYDEKYRTQTTELLDQGRPFPITLNIKAIMDILTLTLTRSY